MIKDIFSIDNFNVISDDKYYYFFRALNMGDINDIDNNITLDENNNIFRIRTDRERYELISKYNEYSNLSLEEIFDHIKMHHRKDTNCISLTSNANVAIMYGREYYKDKYVMIKVPKNELGKDIVDAGFYMLNEVNNSINNMINNSELNEEILYYIKLIDNATNQEKLDNVINYIKTNINNYEFDDSIYEKGIEFTSTNSLDYSALNEEQNFHKNKIISKLDIIKKNVIKNVSNRFLIQTIGNAFSSLELTHYKDIKQDKIVELPKEMIDIFSLLQQVPKDNKYINELKQVLLNYINSNNITNLEEFNYDDKDINIDNEYTIENMYNLTNGSVSFNDSYNLYKKLFYLSKSRLRTMSMINNLNKILNNPKYFEIFTYLENNTYGVEPKIFTRLTSNKLRVSESVSIDIKRDELELFNFIKKLNKEELNYIINNPVKSLKYYLNNFNIERTNLDKETYYATSIIELYDWENIGVINLSLKHQNNIINKLKENNVVEVYNRLKELGIKEKDIANVLLTLVIKEKNINEDIDLKDTFTVEELEDFLGYYQIKGTSKLKLRSYQASAKKNIDENFSKHNFTCAILPTGAGKSFVSLAEMLNYKDKEILYLAPNDEILNQLEDYIIEYIYGNKNTLTKSKKQIIKEVFPNLKLCTYSSLLSFNQKEIINKKYDLIIFDELHRTGAKEWKKQVLELVKNQDNSTKVLGITATPQRDMDLMNMASYWAEYFGYTEEEIIKGEHLAINMNLEDAIKLGYVVNPKVVECEYSSLNKSGLLDNLIEKIKYVDDEEKRNILIKKHDVLRRKVNNAKGTVEVIGDNLKIGDKVIVFCPVLNKDGSIIDNELNDKVLDSEEVIEKYIKQIKEYLMTYYNKTEEEINSMVDFNSMLGKYSKSKNRRQLELFEQDNKDKIKFMIVINKLNEGSHINGVNKIIWFRPMNENSKILCLQQMGRIITAKTPNKKIKEEDRPMLIDLVGNLVRINLGEKETVKTSDLDKMKLAINWIDLNNRIPDVNSFDRVEKAYGRSLRRIKEKYLIYINNDNLLDDLTKRQRIEILEILRLGNNIDLWNYEFPNIIKQDNKNDEKELDDDFDLFELDGMLKDFVELNDEINANIKILTVSDKIEEYIEKINEGYYPKRYETEQYFSNGEAYNYFWQVNKQKIKEELKNNPRYKNGYEIALDTISKFKSRLLIREKTIEYIERLNEGYIPKRHDPEEFFSSEEAFNYFWPLYKDRVKETLEKDVRYKNGYELAKKTVKDKFVDKVDEYIEKLNNNYKPRYSDSEECFSNGERINTFWKVNQDKIKKELETNPKYKDYIIAKKTIKDLEIDKIDEFIKELNKGYIPRARESDKKFSNGDVYNTYWQRHKEEIIIELNANEKYQEGYEIAKKVIKDILIDKVSEFIEMLNKGLVLKNTISNVYFSNGDEVNQFWPNNKEKIIDELESNSKYNEGYEVAKKAIKDREIDKVAEFIEKLNKGYIPIFDDKNESFSNGDIIRGFWSKYKEKIKEEIETNPKYQDGYEKSKKTVRDKFIDKKKEFIGKLNNGYKPKTYDSEESFSNGEKVNHFWTSHKKEIINELKTNPNYKEGYEIAKKMVEDKIIDKVAEFIEMLNNGLVPKNRLYNIYFSNGEGVNTFWANSKEKIKKEIDINPKYKGYKVAKKIIKDLEIDKIDEFIKKLNAGYIPISNEKNDCFSNGDFIGSFWANNKETIKVQLETNSKYKNGYELARKIVKDKEINKLGEFIDKLNIGYIPKNKETYEKFSNGDFIGSYWVNNRETIKRELETNSKYKNGYEVAKRVIKDKEIDKIGEYIDKLNNGYLPQTKDSEDYFSNGDVIGQFWPNNKKDIIKEIEVNVKYQGCYEQAKNTIETYKNRESINENINNINNLCKYYNIDLNKNKSLLKKSCNEVYAKICYLIDNNISICDNDGIVHAIFFMSDINMQAKYNISFKDLIEKYVYDSNKFRSV